MLGADLRPGRIAALCRRSGASCRLISEPAYLGDVEGHHALGATLKQHLDQPAADLGFGRTVASEIIQHCRFRTTATEYACKSGAMWLNGDAK